MQNLLKSLFFDVSLFVALPFLSWIKLTVSKYGTLLCFAFGKKNGKLIIGERHVYVSSVSDLGTMISSLSDEYHHLRKIVGETLSIVVDVGANIGQFSAAINYWFPMARVISIEADPQTYVTLVRNSQLTENQNINLAISDKKEKIDFYRGDLSVTSSLIKTHANQNSIKINADTLDAVLAPLDKIDLIKIDVEGAELNALRGAQHSLSRCTYLLLEVSFLRETMDITNLDVLCMVREMCPAARIIHTGRRLGWGDQIVAQDFLIKLKNQQ